MITFRYHVVSLVSVFLALAVGIALGGGPLKGEVDNSLVSELAAQKKSNDALRSRVSALSASGRFSDAYAAGTAPAVLDKTLAGTTVALVSLPGADQRTVARLSALVRTSGGRVGGTYRVGAKLGDDDDKGLVDQLGSQLLVDTPGLQVPADASTYERFGLLLARAIGVRQPGAAAYDTASSGIVSAFQTAGLVSPVGTPTRRAQVVLLVTGPGDDSGTQAGIDEVHATVADAMTGRVRAVVLAGPAGAAEKGGLLLKVRSDVGLASRMSTIDSAGSGPGGVVTMLAVAADLRSGTGQYGAVDAADGAVPGASGG